MICKTITSLTGLPSTATLFGTTSSQGVISMINDQYRDSNGVIFAMDRDPYRDKYMQFMTVVDTNARLLGNKLKLGLGVFNSDKKIIPITSPEQLDHVPRAMWLPILTYQPIRTLFENDQIFGYGLSPEVLPDEDVYGRLIHNGECEFNTITPQKEVTWEWRTTDPFLEVAELNAIEATRGFIDQWLAEQLGPEGDRIDPTDPSGRIGKLKE